MSLGSKIKELRKEHSLSQGGLAKLAGIHEKLISKYENERIVPTADTLKRIAEALHISSDYLIFDNVPKDGRVELRDLELFNKFREVEKMAEEEREAIKKVIDAMIVKNKIEKVMKPEVCDSWDERMRRILRRFRDKAKGYSEEDIVKIIDEAVDAVQSKER